MTFENYQTANDATWYLEVWIGASATSLIIKSDKASLFPDHNWTTDKDYFLTLKQINSNGVVVKREIVKVTEKAWNTFTVERGAWICPWSDSATTQWTTSYSFSADDIVYLWNVSEITKDIKSKIADQDAEISERLTVAEYLSWEKLFAESTTWNDAYEFTISWIASMIEVDWQLFRVRVDVENTDEATANLNSLWSNPIVKRWGDSLVTWDIKSWQVMIIVRNNDETRRELKQSVDQRDSSLTWSLVDADTYLLWEDVVAGDSLFVEDMVDYNDAVTDYASWFSESSSSTPSQSAGYRILSNVVQKMFTVTKINSCTATRAILLNDAWTILDTATFSWDVATFSSPYELSDWVYYRVHLDSNWWTYSRRNDLSPTYPASDFIEYVWWSRGTTTNDSDTYNITSIATTWAYSLGIQNIGDVTANTRVSIPALWSGVAASTLKLALKKFVSPWVDLKLRIETDNAGEPSGTLVDANATAIVTEASLTTVLVDTTVTLAGSITVAEWTRVHIVLYAWIYWSETVNGTNYFGVGYGWRTTTTRLQQYYDGASWSLTDQSNVLDTGSVLWQSTVSWDSNWYRMQAKDRILLKSVTKDSNDGAEWLSIMDDAWVEISRVNFIWDLATIPTNIVFEKDDYFRLETDIDGTHSIQLNTSPTFPYDETNVIFDIWSQNWSNNTNARNIESVTTALVWGEFNYMSSDLFTPKLLSKTNAWYSYKLPTDLPRIATEAKSSWENCISIYKWLADLFSGMTPLTPMYISNTAWEISASPGTNTYEIGTTINDTILWVDL